MFGTIPLSRKLAALALYPIRRATGYPISVTIEVTKRCNARCDFCDYWKTKAETVLEDYGPVVRTLKPNVVTFSGGEPLLRPDLERIVRRVRAESKTVYLTLLTHGAMLTLERGLALRDAGLDQINISLDFLDERHDRARGIPGLAPKIMAIAPALAGAGVQTVFNTVVRADNLDQIAAIARWAADHGIKAAVSAYADVKSGNAKYVVTANQMAELRGVIGELLRMKAAGGPIVTSTYYLSRVPEFFAAGGIPGCTLGPRGVHVTPDGTIKRCPEFPPECHYTEWTPHTFAPTGCDACWYNCRGEAQAPMNWERVKYVLRV